MSDIQRVFLWSFLGAMIVTVAWRVCGAVWGISGPGDFPLLPLTSNNELCSVMVDTIIVFLLPTIAICAIKILSMNMQSEDREGEGWFFCGVGSIFAAVGFAIGGTVSIVICVFLLVLLYLSDKVMFEDGKITPLFPALIGFFLTLFLLKGVLHGWFFPWAILIIFPVRSFLNGIFLRRVRVREALGVMFS